MEPVTADLRESGPNEGEKFPWNLFYCFYNKKTAKCDGYMRHIANESAPKEQQRLL